ncbi:unnamed protein product, partial [Rotaria socialis]
VGAGGLADTLRS